MHWRMTIGVWLLAVTLAPAAPAAADEGSPPDVIRGAGLTNNGPVSIDVNDGHGHRHEFSDSVDHSKYHFVFGRHREFHDGQQVVGEYSLKEPSGNVRNVKYVLDTNGFHAEVYNSFNDPHFQPTQESHSGYEGIGSHISNDQSNLQSNVRNDDQNAHDTTNSSYRTEENLEGTQVNGFVTYNESSQRKSDPAFPISEIHNPQNDRNTQGEEVKNPVNSRNLQDEDIRLEERNSPQNYPRTQIEEFHAEERNNPHNGRNNNGEAFHVDEGINPPNGRNNVGESFHVDEGVNPHNGRSIDGEVHHVDEGINPQNGRNIDGQNFHFDEGINPLNGRSTDGEDFHIDEGMNPQIGHNTDAEDFHVDEGINPQNGRNPDAEDFHVDEGINPQNGRNPDAEDFHAEEGLNSPDARSTDGEEQKRERSTEMLDPDESGYHPVQIPHNPEGGFHPDIHKTLHSFYKTQGVGFPAEVHRQRTHRPRHPGWVRGTDHKAIFETLRTIM